MESSDRVEPVDAALQALLASVAEHSDDVERRDRLLDAVMTIPPIAEWPEESLEVLRETCRYVISLARLGREIEHLTQSYEE